jgi:hypothetical protein
MRVRIALTEKYKYSEQDLGNESDLLLRMNQFTRRFQFSSTMKNMLLNPLLFNILMKCGRTRLLRYLLIHMKEPIPCSRLIFLILVKFMFSITFWLHLSDIYAWVMGFYQFINLC